MSLKACETIENVVRRQPWAWGCSRFECYEAKGIEGLVVIKGDCDERVVALYQASGWEAEGDSESLQHILEGRLEGFKSKCIYGSLRVHSVTRAGLGPRGAWYEASTPPYGAVHVKVNHRLPGSLRESRLLEYLTRTGFPLVPRLLCSVDSDGSDYIIVTEKVEGQPVALSFVEAARHSLETMIPIIPPVAPALGLAVGMLHEALYSCPEEWCRPRRASKDDLKRWVERLRARASMLRSLAEGAGDDRLLLLEASDSLEDLARSSIEAADDLLEGYLVMTHGDLHLYQVYREPSGRLVFTDFEGEPGRAPASPDELEPDVRDLAALARSLDYARALGAMAALGVDPVEAARAASTRLRGWVLNTFKAVLTGYTSVRRGFKLRETSFTFWLAERASYESIYELTYKTGLHPLPLEAIIRLREGREEVVEASL